MKTVGNFWVTFFFFKYYFHGLLVHIIKELKKSRSLKCHSFCWVFYWKLKESRVASYYYNNRFKRRPPVIRSLWRKKNVLPNFSSSTGSIRHEQNLIFFFFFFYAFSRYICIIREKTDSVLDSVSNPIPHGWNEKKKKIKILEVVVTNPLLSSCCLVWPYDNDVKILLSKLTGYSCRRDWNSFKVVQEKRGNDFICISRTAAHRL